MFWSKEVADWNAPRIVLTLAVSHAPMNRLKLLEGFVVPMPLNTGAQAQRVADVRSTSRRRGADGAAAAWMRALGAVGSLTFSKADGCGCVPLADRPEDALARVVAAVPLAPARGDTLALHLQRVVAAGGT